MAAFDITLVGHAGLPKGSDDDRALLAAVTRLGLSARIVVWTDPTVDWSAGRVTILRSTWDYHLQSVRWSEWLDRVSGATHLVNAAPLVRWNGEKTYLRLLADRGVPCIPTAFVAPGDTVSLEEIAKASGWRDVVVKPAVGAAAWGVAKFGRAGHEVLGQSHMEALQRAGTVLIQPFVPQVELAGERSLVMIGERCVHAFTKRAFSSSPTGSVPITPHEPSPEETDLARKALSATPWPARYARVDMVPTDQGLRLMELELIEPDLGFRVSSAALEAFAAMSFQAVSGLTEV